MTPEGSLHTQTPKARVPPPSWKYHQIPSEQKRTLKTLLSFMLIHFLKTPAPTTISEVHGPLSALSIYPVLAVLQPGSNLWTESGKPEVQDGTSRECEYGGSCFTMSVNQIRGLSHVYNIKLHRYKYINIYIYVLLYIYIYIYRYWMVLDDMGWCG